MAVEVEYTQSHQHASDGVELFVQRWEPADGTIRAEVLVVHGYGEHGARYRELAHRLAEGQIATVAVDIRGHGRSAGQRGHVRKFSDYYLDVEVGLAALGDAPHFVLGHSHGGLLALDFIAQRRPELAGLIITNAFLEIGMPVPAPKIWAARILSKIYPSISMSSGISPGGLSHDQDICEAYERDPLVSDVTTPGWFVESSAAQKRVRALTEVAVPLLYLFSDADPLCAPAANRELAEALRSPDKTVRERAGEFHEILNEVGRVALHEEIRDWILERAD